MNYEETLAYIHQTPKFSRVLGNHLLEQLLFQLGNPQNNQKYIHIGGTNGKGSVTAMTANILKTAGYRVGTFTSPYLEQFNERIAVDGVPISDWDLSRIATDVRICIEKHHTYVSEFALDLAIAFLYFAEKNCDFVILEVGMGGRLDATNVIQESLVTALTSIGWDHMQYLGHSLSEITAEKCGIIKDGGCVITASGQEETVMKEIMENCQKKKADLHIADISLAEGYSLGLAGSFQRKNATVAIEIVHVLSGAGYVVSDEAIADGIAGTKWPGRFERIGKRLILDGAHNRSAAEILAQELVLTGEKIHLVTAMMADKEIEETVRILAPIAGKVTATEVDILRCCPADELKAQYQHCGVPAQVITPAVSAVSQALQEEEYTICVCGSLYLVGEIRKRFKNLDH